MNDKVTVLYAVQICDNICYKISQIIYLLLKMSQLEICIIQQLNASFENGNKSQKLIWKHFLIMAGNRTFSWELKVENI
jgi:hypothetical protein